MEVRARAPGKIILAGEHAVVHGSAAVAASIGLYTSASLRFPSPSDNDDNLTLHLMDVGLDFSWPVRRIKEVLPDSVNSITSSPTTCSPETVKLIATLVEEHTIPEGKTGIASGVIAFLWLYTSIQGNKPATVNVSSELPLGAGLGSSAAFCVSLSGAFLALSDSVKVDFSQEGWVVFGEKEQQLANKWAFEGEKIIHGKPSGIDNTVSTFGNLIKFKSGALTCIKSNMILKMLITNTKVGRNTKSLVAGVSERKNRHPDAMTSVFTAVDSISNELASIIQSSSDDDLEKEQRVEELMEMNQGLLKCMGVSHASIETVLRTTFKYKLTSKLTGAGGGGCVLTLLPARIKIWEELKVPGLELLTLVSPLPSAYSWPGDDIITRVARWRGKFEMMNCLQQLLTKRWRSWSNVDSNVSLLKSVGMDSSSASMVSHDSSIYNHLTNNKLCTDGDS